MHSKHRNGPGNLYRSNSMGVGGVAAATQISPEGPVRGHRMYGTEYRNYNRDGYGRIGRSKHFQPMPPAQEVDVFVEAGRLAAEYLVAKGVLPPNALSGKWQGDVLKNQVGNFQEFRQHQVDRVQNPSNGRASVHSRLGNAAVEAGPGRRRYSDEYSSLDSRSSNRERKRTGSFKNYGTEANRESGRSESWAEKSRVSPGKEADGDASVGHNAEQSVDKDGNCRVRTSSPPEVTKEVISEAHTEPASQQPSLVEDADANSNTLSNEKCLPSDTEREQIKKSDDANKFNDATEVVEERRNDNDLEQNVEKAKEVMSSIRECSSVSECHIDLAQHCKFMNVPTKTRSSLSKGSKGDLEPRNEHVNISKKELSESSAANAMDDDIGSSGGNASLQESHELKCLQSDMSSVPAVDKELHVAQKSSPGQNLMPGFNEISRCKGQEPDEQLSEFQNSNSMFVERGEKRAMEYDSDAREDFKKIRQCFPPLAAESDCSLLPSSSMADEPSIQEQRTPQSAHVTISPDEKNVGNSLFPRGHSDSGEFMEEKQLFPGSFKTCDLNLDGNCDVNENNDASPMLVFPSVTQAGKVGAPIGIDLSMSHNRIPNKSDKHGVEDNGIEVIDLDSDSGPEHKTFGNPERRGDAVFADLDGFPNSVHNPNAMPDVQDGYGLMISELLANGSPNCSSVPNELNLHNHMGLPNTEGMLGDDDSIYMSLGEIPISLLAPWEQQAQDYGKPF